MTQKLSAAQIASLLGGQLNRSLPSCVVKSGHLHIKRAFYGMTGAGVYGERVESSKVHWIAEVTSAKDNPKHFEGTAIFALRCYDGMYYAPSVDGTEAVGSKETLLGHVCFDPKASTADPDKIDHEFTGNYIHYRGGLIRGEKNPVEVEYASYPHENSSFMRFFASIQQVRQDFNMELVEADSLVVTWISEDGQQHCAYPKADFLNGKTLIIEPSELIPMDGIYDKDGNVKTYTYPVCKALLDGQTAESVNRSDAASQDELMTELQQVLSAAGLEAGANGKDIAAALKASENKDRLIPFYRGLSEDDKQRAFASA